ncbi:MAG: hypothetical protein B6U76_05030 [Desulfurococcales archaeon ex4484_217_2]|nr:MAG: hypothetical protein B6U76_05030 [Desulfurococcales archaeon ex4484_217_2]
MGRRRKKRKLIARRPKKTIPNVFQCPNCGKIAVTVELDKPVNGIKHAVIKCGNCGLYAEMDVPELFHNVDVYGRFLDGFYSGTLEYRFLTSSEEEKVEELA